jgi:hypothetical protein
MKRYINFSVAIMIVCGVFAISGRAQSNVSPTIRASIPFTFQVGDKSLPAGVYTVRILNPTSDRKTLQIRNDDGRFSAIVQTTGVKDAIADNTKLVFRRYGEQYFFAQAQLAGDTTSLAATKTRAERAMQRALKHRDRSAVIAIVAH